MGNSAGKATIGSVLSVIAVIVVALIIMWHLGAVDDAKHIEAVLAQNKALEDALNREVQNQKTDAEEDFDHIAEYLDDFVERARTIDTHQCPREFAEAYSRYVSAFAEEAAMLHAHPHIPSGEEAILATVIKGLQGDPMGEVRAISDSLDAWAKRWRDKADRATQAGRDVKDIAVRYELYSWPRWD